MTKLPHRVLFNGADLTSRCCIACVGRCAHFNALGVFKDLTCKSLRHLVVRDCKKSIKHFNICVSSLCAHESCSHTLVTALGCEETCPSPGELRLLQVTDATAMIFFFFFPSRCLAPSLTFLIIQAELRPRQCFSPRLQPTQQDGGL